MAWSTLTTAPTWNVTDLELLKRLQYHLLENTNGADADGVNLLTTMFTIQEFVDALNTRQQQFIRDTGSIVARASEGTTAGITRYTLPADWVWTARLTWQAQAAGSNIYSLPRVDSYALDHGMSDWEQNTADPSVYNDGSDLPTLTIEIAKGPSQAGSMTLLYVNQPVTLTGLGVSLTIPDEMESAVLYGALSDLLAAGETNDPERAAYCEMRYQLAVEMTKGLLEGVANG